MSIQHSATSSLLAAPSVQADPSGKPFTVVRQGGGYHRGEVDEWVHWALAEIEKGREEVDRLARQAMPVIGRELASPQGQKLMVEVLQVIADEATGQQAAAAQEVEEMIAGARQQAEEIITSARQQADQHVARATQQAAALVEGARNDAKATTDNANLHAAAVHEAAEQRLAAFLKVHEDGLARMKQMHEVTGQYMAAEQARGSLRDEVERARAAVQRP